MMKFIRPAKSGILAALATIVLLGGSAGRADNWPCWRGPTGMGYTDEKDLPLRWDGKTKENLLWKVPLGGIGNSSPIVWGDRVFVTVSRKQTNQEQDAKMIPEHWVACFQTGRRQGTLAHLVPRAIIPAVTASMPSQLR